MTNHRSTAGGGKPGALIVIGLAAALSSCASTPTAKSVRSTPHAQVNAPPSASIEDTHYTGSLPGNYRAAKVAGDYAGYRSLDLFIQRMAEKHGFPRDYLNGLFSQAQRKQWTLNYLSREAGPAVTTPRPGAWTRYRAQFLTEPHISGGVAFWQHHAAALERASEKYGVPPEYIIGIMGVETIYGRNVGTHRVIDALTTLAFDYPRRGDYFAEELEKFLIMASREGIDPARPVGSYAGAMGFGQFMPSSFLQWAVDFDGDGRRDLWQSDDVIGSIANYFSQHGWRRGEPVTTHAVATHANVQNLETGYDTQYSLNDLVRQGIKPASPCPDQQPLRLLRLRAMSGDDYWLGHQNFYVITRYNHSTHYAMAVHQLAQAVKQRYMGH